MSYVYNSEGGVQRQQSPYNWFSLKWSLGSFVAAQQPPDMEQHLNRQHHHQSCGHLLMSRATEGWAHNLACLQVVEQGSRVNGSSLEWHGLQYVVLTGFGLLLRPLRLRVAMHRCCPWSAPGVSWPDAALDNHKARPIGACLMKL